MGYEDVDGIWVDVVFRSAYVLITHEAGKNAFTGRVDVFDTRDHASSFYGDNNETGWALTGAWRRPLNKYLDLRVEAMRIESTRPSRVQAGFAPKQAQTVLQSSLRLTF